MLRRGYGNQCSLAQRWQDVLVRHAFAPHLQYQYASGKNTADIALALDAMEALVDRKADTFCLVTSDSDFAYLCRKLRERDGIVCIVGEPKTPEALRNASDEFFEWVRPEAPECPNPAQSKPQAVKADPTNAKVKRRPLSLVQAVELLASATSEGRVDLGALGQYLKRTDSSFSPQSFGHSGLLDMVRSYDLLETHQGKGGHWSVSLARNGEVS